MKESFYRLPGPRPLRLALVADLHGQAPDAVLVDTTEIDFDQSFELLCRIIREAMEKAE